MDVALRLSYQTPLLLSSTVMKSQEVGVSQKQVGPGGSWGGRTGSYAVKYLQ